MNILIAGGSGFLGTALTKSIMADTAYQQRLNQATAQDVNAAINVTWLTRQPQQDTLVKVQLKGYDQLDPAQDKYDIIINLAGAGIADKRWSHERKQELLDSRIEPSQALIDYIETAHYRPLKLLSGSAIGWYGAQGDMPLDEHSHVDATDEFTHELCAAWELVALKAQRCDVPVCLIRTGVVLHPEGGMLKKLLLPFKLGLGGRIGDGKQILSWIALQDWVNALKFLMLHQAAQGVYNLTSPYPVSNQDFTQVLANTLSRFAMLPVPAGVIELMLGEMSTLLLEGQYVLPTRLQQAGFAFEYPTLSEALTAQLKSS